MNCTFIGAVVDRKGILVAWPGSKLTVLGKAAALLPFFIQGFQLEFQSASITGIRDIIKKFGLGHV